MHPARVRGDRLAASAALGATDRSKAPPAIEERVARAAEQALAERRYVSAIDVLTGLGWLAPSHLAAWRGGRVSDLESVVSAGLGKVSTALRVFRRWAERRGLQPSETAYLARTRDRRPPDLVVISPRKDDWTCAGCGGTGGLLIMEQAGPVCLTCADMEHLRYLPSGDAALTRRAKAGSRLSAVVVRFSRARRRYERQGILVEEAALEEAERQCLADAEARAPRRERDEVRRAAVDRALEAQIAAEIRRLSPGCPAERAEAITRHTAARGSGRIGRTAAARALDRDAIEMAVRASVRHADTEYDDLLMSGVDRDAARTQVQSDVARTLDAWRQHRGQAGGE